MNINWQLISEQISAASGQSFNIIAIQALNGGDINLAFRLTSINKQYFIKLNKVELVEMFYAELLGLEEIASTQTVKVPIPLIAGTAESHSFLVMEYLQLQRPTQPSARRLGEQLANLHRLIQPYFGWHRTNTIGNTPQSNFSHDNWCVFWQEQRLSKQLKLAADNGYTGKLQRLGELILTNIETFFAHYQPHASLLHGDLWSGNWSSDNLGNPVIFDPACYYGDRETDLAMTELFGGFSQDFYSAYQDNEPLDKDYRYRKNLYNLYHILNHLNLFGGYYLNQAENAMSKLLAEMR